MRQRGRHEDYNRKAGYGGGSYNRNSSECRTEQDYSRGTTIEWSAKRKLR